MSKDTCVLPGCDKPQFSRGVCRQDYTKLVNGDLPDDLAALAKPARTPKPVLTCASCGNDFKATKQQKYRADEGKNVYCSRDCQYRDHRVMVECSVCGTQVERQKHLLDRNKTGQVLCSADCRNKVSQKPKTGRYVTCELDGCENEVWVKKSEEGRKRFCSRDHAQRAQERREERTCGNCQETFTARLSDSTRYCSRACFGESRRAKIGDRYIDPKGYAWLWVDGGDGQPVKVQEHRYVMEQHVGRSLKTWETVHHKTEGFKGRSNNDLRNLELWASRHPYGHRAEDIAAYCREMLGLYGDDAERERYATEAAAVLEADK